MTAWIIVGATIAVVAIFDATILWLDERVRHRYWCCQHNSAVIALQQAQHREHVAVMERDAALADLAHFRGPRRRAPDGRYVGATHAD